MSVRQVIAISVPLILAALAVSVFGAARVHSDSMSPTLSEGDTVIFDRASAPARGDIVIFDQPDSWSAPGQTLVKRVIGTAGDVVTCCEAGTGRLLLDGVGISESYAGARPGGSIRFEITVPDGSVWLMGDNRDRSYDSRAELGGTDNGLVSISQLRGVIRGHW